MNGFIVIPYMVESLATLIECHDSYFDASYTYAYTLQIH